MWRKYEVNEKGLRSEFINMEKIKITQAIVLKNINVLKLIQKGLADTYFPIHDPYQLRGNSKEPFFKTLYDASLMNEPAMIPGEKEMKKLFQDMADEAESTDFDAQSLEEEAKFNFKIPWEIPIDSMRDYFGEKIALYFDFLRFYTK
jgi:anoctamin-10